MPQLKERKSIEDREMEEIIRRQAEYAQSLQRDITAGQDLEKWVADGHFEFLESRVLRTIEQQAFQTIKAPEFDPSNLSQVAQLKALCQTLDLIRANIVAQIATVKDARTKLRDIERSTLHQDE